VGWCLCTAWVRPFFTDPPAESIGEVIQVVLALTDGLGIAAQQGGDVLGAVAVHSVKSVFPKIRRIG
jgi:hypothetical protein